MQDTMNFVLKVKDDGSAVIQKFTGKLGELEEKQKRVSKGSKEMDQSFKQLKSSASSLHSSFSTLKTTMVGMMAAAGIGGLVAGLKNVVQVGAEFQKTMTTVRVISEANEVQFGSLTSKAMELGAKTEFSARQIAAAFKELSMAGLSVEQQLEVIAPMVDLATAGNISLAEAADIAASTLVTMKLSVTEMTRVSDVLAFVANTTATDVKGLAESFKYAGNVGSAFGFSVEHITGLLGLLGNANLRGEMAGSQLSQSIVQMNEVFQKYGTTLKNGKKVTMDIVGAVKMLEDRQVSATKIMEIFGVHAGRAMTTFVNMGSKAMEDYLDKLKDVEGTTQRNAALMRDTVAGAWDKFAAAIENVKIETFNERSSLLKTTLEDMSSWITANSEFFLDLADSMAVAAAAAWALYNGLNVVMNVAMKSPAAKASGVLDWIGKKYNALLDSSNETAKENNKKYGTGYSENTRRYDSNPLKEYSAEYQKDIDEAKAGFNVALDKLIEMKSSQLEAKAQRAAARDAKALFDADVKALKEAGRLAAKGAGIVPGRKVIENIPSGLGDKSDKDKKGAAQAAREIFEIERDLSDKINKLKQTEKDNNISAVESEIEAIRKKAGYANASAQQRAEIEMLMTEYKNQKILENEGKTGSQLAKLKEEFMKESETVDQEIYDYRKKELDKYIDRLRAAGIEEVTIRKETNKKLFALESKKAKSSGKFTDGIKAAGYEILEEEVTWATVGENVLKTAYANIGQAFSDSVFAIISGDIGQLKDIFLEFVKSIVSAFLSAVAQMIAQWLLFQVLFPGLGGGGGGGGMLSSVTSMFGFAEGGRPPLGKPSWVGEKGPELFIPDSSGIIVPNHKLRDQSSGGSSPVNVTFNISGNVVGNESAFRSFAYKIGDAIRVKDKRRYGG